MSTLKDIARIAGVNVSTVSKALRNSTDIKEETKQKIVGIATQLNYSFKTYSTNETINQATGLHGFVGIICPEVKSDYYSQIISGIEDELKKDGYFCVIGSTNFDLLNEEYYLNHFINSGMEGIIYITENKDLERGLCQFKSAGSKPLVLISQNYDDKNIDCIKIDDEYGVRLAVEYLIDKGHKEIYYLGDDLSKSRMNVFSKIVNEHNVDIDRKWMRVSKKRFEECGYDLMNEIIKSSSKLPTAVVAAYDDIAIGAIKAIYDNNLRVPDDISIIGIDNICMAQYSRPELTTVAGPVEEMGKISVNILLKKIKNNQFNIVQNICLTPRLIERRSVKQLK